MQKHGLYRKLGFTDRVCKLEIKCIGNKIIMIWDSSEKSDLSFGF